jgi:hypothetical protein
LKPNNRQLYQGQVAVDPNSGIIGGLQPREGYFFFQQGLVLPKSSGSGFGPIVYFTPIVIPIGYYLPVERFSFNFVNDFPGASNAATIIATITPQGVKENALIGSDAGGPFPNGVIFNLSGTNSIGGNREAQTGVSIFPGQWQINVQAACDVSETTDDGYLLAQYLGLLVKDTHCEIAQGWQ